MMDVNKILQADVLEIIFEGRNKTYGAYELRTNYKKRLTISVISMVFICAAMLLLYSIANGSSDGRARDLYVETDVKLDEVQKKEEPIVVEPPKPQEVKPIETQKFVTPIITKEEVKPEEMPPQQDELEDAKIGLADVKGDKDNDIVAPPVDGKDNGVIALPEKKNDNPDEIVLHVQIESEYPGGIQSWLRFLNKNLKYPDDAIENGIQGPVLVQFIVDREGNVSEVQAVSGPKELWGEAERVIKKSGKWTPAIQNGRQVKSYKRQPIVFKLEGD